MFKMKMTGVRLCPGSTVSVNGKELSSREAEKIVTQLFSQNQYNDEGLAKDASDENINVINHTISYGNVNVIKRNDSSISLGKVVINNQKYNINELIDNGYVYIREEEEYYYDGKYYDSYHDYRRAMEENGEK